jgi:hypothetical protein
MAVHIYKRMEEVIGIFHNGLYSNHFTVIGAKLEQDKSTCINLHVQFQHLYNTCPYSYLSRVLADFILDCVYACVSL